MEKYDPTIEDFYRKVGASVVRSITIVAVNTLRHLLEPLSLRLRFFTQRWGAVFVKSLLMVPVTIDRYRTVRSAIFEFYWHLSRIFYRKVGAFVGGSILIGTIDRQLE